MKAPATDDNVDRQRCVAHRRHPERFLAQRLGEMAQAVAEWSEGEEKPSGHIITEREESFALYVRYSGALVRGGTESLL